jgi:hypothetical protein
VFRESAFGMQQALKQLHITSTVTEAPDDMNSEPSWVHAFARLDVLFIVYGAHLFEQLPKRYILMQMEQLSSPYITDTYLHSMTEALHVWDFSHHNAHVLKRRANLQQSISVIPVHIVDNSAAMPRMMQKGVSTTRQLQPIDVLFYGHLNEHRASILDDLRSENLTVRYEHNVLSAERDALVSRSKIVLNLHYLPDAALEVHRINPVLMLGKCIISEPSVDALLDAKYSSGIVFAHTPDIVHTVQRLINDHLQLAWWESNSLLLSRQLQSESVVSIREGLLQAVDASKQHQ